jgi:hypothetical protein
VGSSSSFTRYSSGTSRNPYDWLNSPSSRAAAGDYAKAAATGAHGQPAATTPRYGTASDRYGLGGPTTDPFKKTATGSDLTANPYAEPRDPGHSRYATGQQPPGGASRYDAPAGAPSAPGSNRDRTLAADARYSASPYSGSPTGSAGTTGYGSRSDFPSSSEARPADPYSAARDPLKSRYGSAAQDGYARGDATSNPADSSSHGGRYTNVSTGSAWNPGDTGYRPGALTENTPGQSDYDPGNTGYQPPGIPPYQSPARSYTPPTGTADYSPYTPGSVRPYVPRTPDSPGGSSSDSSDRPEPDSQVIPAAHAPYPSRLR